MKSIHERLRHLEDRLQLVESQLRAADHRLKRAERRAAEPNLGPESDSPLSPAEEWWLERLSEGTTLKDGTGWLSSLPKEELYADYVRYAEARGVAPVSPTSLGIRLSRLLPPGAPGSVQRYTDVRRWHPTAGEVNVRARVYYYVIPPLKDCLAAWGRRFDGPPKDS